MNSKKSFDIARMALADYIADVLTDLIDPAEDEIDELRETMTYASSLIIEGLALTVIDIDSQDEGLVTVTVNLGLSPTD